MPTRIVQDFITADILASGLVFITTRGPLMLSGPTVPTRALFLLPGYPLTGLVVLCLDVNQ